MLESPLWTTDLFRPIFWCLSANIYCHQEACLILQWLGLHFAFTQPITCLHSVPKSPCDSVTMLLPTPLKLSPRPYRGLSPSDLPPVRLCHCYQAYCTEPSDALSASIQTTSAPEPRLILPLWQQSSTLLLHFLTLCRHGKLDLLMIF